MTLPGGVLTQTAQVLTAPTSTRHLAARAVGFGAFYLLGAWLSIGSRLPGSSQSLVWPAAGVATVWLLTATRRSLRVDVAALVVVCAMTVLVAGGSRVHAVAFVGATVAAALLMRTLLRRWAPRVTAPLEGDAVRNLSTFVALATGAACAAVVEAVGAPALLHLLSEDPRWATAPLRWVRSWTAVFIVTSTWLLLLAALGRRVGTAEEQRRRSYGLPRQRGRSTEAAALVTVTVVLLVGSLGLFPDVPITFVAFAPAAWVAVRFSPLTAASYAVVTGLVTTAATLDGRGTYALVDSSLLAALLAQSYFAILYTTVITLALISTRLRTAEQEAQSRAELLDGVLGAASDGIVLVDDTGRVLLANRMALTLLAPISTRDASPVDQVSDLGFERLRLTDGAGTPPRSNPHEAALRGEIVLHEDLLLPGDAAHPDRVLRFCAHSVAAIGHPGAQALMTFSDVTTEHEQTSALQAFAGDVAHDLKNPLSVIEGWSEMLEGEFVGAGSVPAADGLPMVRRVQRAAASMRSLIDGLLLYTVARGHTLDLDLVDLTRVVDQVVAADRRSSTTADPPPVPVVEVDAPHLVRADRVLVRQLLDNLLGNAFKYVAPGTVPHVRVTTHLEDRGERVRVDVVDNGLGVPEEHRRHIFDSLYRIDRPGYDGTGLGLAICSRIVDRHGGSLTVTDGPEGIGSTFTFSLPAARP